ncbi:penicillin-binding transpeptidase domain-containing protein [Sphaerisporangium sp. NPDC088356]|uniref:penicillin-binding transpeptidase domain-containing protein n=1 Tax=Sphaerisporangium sp. NPDC088356 TaxID=3154871 RepID=UPI003414A50D
MRRRGLLALVVVSLVIVAAALVALVVDSRRVTGSPRVTGQAYLDAWAAENLAEMRELVASPPPDFLDQHRRLSTDLQILSIKLTPGAVVRRGERSADMPFEGARQIGELGQWKFSSVLHLAVRDGGWKVVWTPETLHPGLAANERLRMTEIPVPGTDLLTRQGKPLPHDSGAERYFKDLTGRVDDLYVDPPTGWAIEAVASTGKSRRLVVFRQAAERRFRTTLDWWTQAAAARALDGVSDPAAIVAVRPSTGEVLAVADRLPGQGAFYRPYPVEDLGEGGLRREAAEFGFGGKLKSGLGGVCGTVRDAGNGDQPGADAIGRNSVRATPLCMALVAAAVQNGTWRPPRLMSEDAVGRLETDGRPRPRKLPPQVLAPLRSTMTAVVTDGTAAPSGLPAGVAGKTGTARAASGEDHAWFVGYRGDLAFAVLVEHGGTGAAAATPIAVRFLDAL